MAADDPIDGAVDIQEAVEDYNLGDKFRIIRAKLRHRLFGGGMSEPISRISFERGDSVGVMLYDREHDAVVLVRQFRYPVYAGLERDHGAGGFDPRRAWILEIVAGVQESGQAAADVGNKELLEEAGYAVTGDLQPIATILPSPGGTSERIHIFLGAVDLHTRAAEGGGVAAEGEDIQIVTLPLHRALAMVASGEITDAKTIVALQHLALKHGG